MLQSFIIMPDQRASRAAGHLSMGTPELLGSCAHMQLDFEQEVGLEHLWPKAMSS